MKMDKKESAHKRALKKIPTQSIARAKQLYNINNNMEVLT